MSQDTNSDFRTDYETVAVSQTDQVLGPNGNAGDILENLVCIVATAATSTVSIKDGTGSAISILPANTPVGAYSLKIGAKAATDWRVTTGAGVTVLAVGRFT